MPGRPDFSQAGTQGGGQTVAITERPEIQILDLDQTGDVSSGQLETIEVFAPTGSVYTVQQMFLKAPAISGATGTAHIMYIGNTPKLNATRGDANPTSELMFRNGHWDKADVDKQPPDPAAVTLSLQTVTATENRPLKITYYNLTDNTQTSKRTIRLTVKEASY